VGRQKVLGRYDRWASVCLPPTPIHLHVKSGETLLWTATFLSASWNKFPNTTQNLWCKDAQRANLLNALYTQMFCLYHGRIACCQFRYELWSAASPIELCLSPALMLVSWATFSSTLKMEAKYSSWMSVDFQQTTWLKYWVMHPVARVSINIVYRNLRTQQMSVLVLLCTFCTTCFGPYCQ
jgi:hypothetical protein